MLLVGVDSRGKRQTDLTDTMMVASIDPVGHTVSLVSVPRDLIDTPLGDGNVYGPKLNGLLAYADKHPKDFPKGGMRTLRGRDRGAARDPDPLLRPARLPRASSR